MVRTPKLVDNHLQYWNNGGDVIENMFKGCTSLEYVDAEDFTGIYGSGLKAINFSDCPNLVYLKLGDMCGGINLTNCLNLDLATLNDTLLRQTGPHSNITFTVPFSIWAAMQNAYPNTVSYIHSICNVLEV